MKITKERIIQIIKEELTDQAASVGGSNVKKLLQQNPQIELPPSLRVPSALLPQASAERLFRTSNAIINLFVMVGPFKGLNLTAHIYIYVNI